MSDRGISTTERARGRWREILPILGVEMRFLVNRHGPCPLCGGKDRFRFDDKEGTGSYYCNQCGAGVGIILVRKLNGWDHATACRRIDEIIGNSRSEPQRGPEKPKPDAGRAIERLLSEAVHASVVGSYLAKRGISVRSSVLRGHAACPYFDGRRMIGRFPAVIAPIIAPDGQIESAHRIYDTAALSKGERKKLMTPVRTISGAAVRLHEPTDTLGVGEGIETCLAAHELFGIPVWAGINDNGVRTFVPPPGVERVLIFGDNDSSFAGQTAAFTLGKRLSTKNIAVEIHIPPKADTDWLDVLNEERGDGK